MNRISLSGRITHNLELRKTPNGKSIVNYSIAVSRDKEHTDFISCATFGESAKTLCEYCAKGDLIGIEGKLYTSQYTDSSNKKHNTYYIITDRIDFLNTSKKSKTTDETEEVKSIDKVYTEDIITEDDLPF